ncbi:putative glycoside hydrolase [Pseudomonas sp. FP1742]|uniref:putative glycoside hydrolase n=1 Tax=Pseudomonas sp. FP1742 TaxID=2954079 RepID=UPI00273338BF|nr:putative glycoside hydrolase [Pseudomonas sp. FP1742]WLG48963.1 putative glycoside hydrolase [Pseudomonas sp. FP1742]
MTVIRALRRYAIPALLAVAALLTGQGAQAVTGVVLDSNTQNPIADAIITTSAGVMRTDENGRFETAEAVERIAARAPGYLRTEAKVGDETPMTLALTPFRPKAVYLSVFGVTSSILRNNAVSLSEKTEINALVIDVKGDRGLTPYRSAAREAIGAAAHVTTRAPQMRDLPALLAKLHAQYPYLIARIVVFKDDPFASAHPEWSVHTADGQPWRDLEQLQWMDPYSHEVWQHNLDVAEEAARMGFDEIQFDYVRFPDKSGLRFALPNNRANRTAAIIGFLQAARARLAPYNVFVSADIFGYVCWNLDDTAIGQQIELLGAELDYISPMLYPSSFTWGLPGFSNPTADPGQIVRRTLAEAMKRTHLPGVRFRPWLQAFRDYAFDRRPFDAEAISAQVNAADAAGTDGWMLWNPRNHYEAADLPQR